MKNLFDPTALLADIYDTAKGNLDKLKLENIKLGYITSGDLTEESHKSIVRLKDLYEPYGVEFVHFNLGEDVTEDAFRARFEEIGHAEYDSDDYVDGILLKYPVPEGITTLELFEMMSPEKDLGAQHPYNAGYLAQGKFEGVANPQVIATLQVVVDWCSKRPPSSNPKNGRVLIISDLSCPPIHNPLLVALNSVISRVVTLHYTDPDLDLFIDRSDVIISMCTGKSGFIGKGITDKHLLIDLRGFFIDTPGYSAFTKEALNAADSVCLSYTKDQLSKIKEALIFANLSYNATYAYIHYSGEFDVKASAKIVDSKIKPGSVIFDDDLYKKGQDVVKEAEDLFKAEQEAREKGIL